MNDIYCFSLYCEGHGKAKSQVFVSIRETEEKARIAAEAANKDMFPPHQGWDNHQQASMIVIPRSLILSLAKEYEKQNSPG